MMRYLLKLLFTSAPNLPPPQKRSSMPIKIGFHFPYHPFIDGEHLIKLRRSDGLLSSPDASAF